MEVCGRSSRLCCALVLPVSWHFLKDYQKARLISFMDPERDPQGTGISVDSVPDCGRRRRDVGQGRHEGNADAASVSAGASYGFHLFGFCRGAWVCRSSGSVGVVFRVDYADRAECADRSGSGRDVYLHGCGALLLFHVLVNVGMVVGRMPVTGIPLPLMSAGGSSIWSIFLMLGLVNNVRLQRFVN